jgi:mannose-6-phosphate isomerase-like protein (cupin superfamily)
MDDYSKVNIRELEDQAPKHGLAPNIQARTAREALGLAASGLGHYRYAPGYRTFGHRHRDQEEVYVVLSGGGSAKVGERVVELHAWDALRVTPAVPRAFQAGPEGLELLVFGSPSDHNRDAELLGEWWMGATR